MTIEERQQKSRNTGIVMTECPVDDCEKSFEEPAGVGRREHLMREHTPEDFNL